MRRHCVLLSLSSWQIRHYSVFYFLKKGFHIHTYNAINHRDNDIFYTNYYITNERNSFHVSRTFKTYTNVRPLLVNYVFS